MLKYHRFKQLLWWKRFVVYLQNVSIYKYRYTLDLIELIKISMIKNSEYCDHIKEIHIWHWRCDAAFSTVNCYSILYNAVLIRYNLSYYLDRQRIGFVFSTWIMYWFTSEKNWVIWKQRHIILLVFCYFKFFLNNKCYKCFF